MNTYTHDDLERDRNDRTHDGRYGYDVEWLKNEVDLNHYASGPGLRHFYSMIEWCIDNCNNKWSVHWSEECVMFDDETDAMAFKLRSCECQ